MPQLNDPNRASNARAAQHLLDRWADAAIAEKLRTLQTDDLSEPGINWSK
jgi:hypothetical protein